MTSENADKPIEAVGKTSVSEHHNPPSWDGWGWYSFALEIQRPWSSLLLDGSKIIETRNYDLPSALIGQRVYILETEAGEDGTSGLGDFISGVDMESNASLNIVGWVVFDEVIEYKCRSEFEGDEEKHLVTKFSNYGWNAKKQVIYGWVISKYGKYGIETKKTGVHSIVRRLRSLYEVRPDPEQNNEFVQANLVETKHSDAETT